MPRAARSSATLNRDVFINCPFDEAYGELFRAIVFTVHACGFRSRCALEHGPNGALRLDTLTQLIASADRGIHDLSRIELSEPAGTPRFNMPFELGVSVGAARFGGRRQRRKQLLVLARNRGQWQPSVSDLSGLDPQFHNDDPHTVIKHVRDFLKGGGERRPGASAIAQDYEAFSADLPSLAKQARQTLPEAREYLNFVEFVAEYFSEAK
ncbi:MAG: hypothetical protein NW203_05230 [Hyphomonadaceae bacterium]|nr:hypothetical protein [Hyphomonadaceae bacterium]